MERINLLKAFSDIVLPAQLVQSMEMVAQAISYSEQFVHVLIFHCSLHHHRGN